MAGHVRREQRSYARRRRRRRRLRRQLIVMHAAAAVSSYAAVSRHLYPMTAASLQCVASEGGGAAALVRRQGRIRWPRPIHVPAPGWRLLARLQRWSAGDARIGEAAEVRVTHRARPRSKSKRDAPVGHSLHSFHPLHPRSVLTQLLTAKGVTEVKGYGLGKRGVPSETSSTLGRPS